MRRRWTSRIAGLVLLVAALQIGLTVVDFAPRLPRLALLVTVCVAVAWLVVDVLGDLGPSWAVAREPAVGPPGQDARLATYLRVLESHATSSTVDGALRDRLARLADRQLERRHGLDRIDPEGRERLGPELLAVVEGGPRHLDVAEIDGHLRRIEEL